MFQTVLYELHNRRPAGVGAIYERDTQLKFKVQSVKDLAVIINHFEKYPLITKKWADYQLFRQALMLVRQKEHLTQNENGGPVVSETEGSGPLQLFLPR